MYTLYIPNSEQILFILCTNTQEPQDYAICTDFISYTSLNAVYTVMIYIFLYIIYVKIMQFIIIYKLHRQ